MLDIAKSLYRVKLMDKKNLCVCKYSKEKNTSLTSFAPDLSETNDIDRSSLVQNKALVGDERATLEDLLAEMHMKYGRYFKKSGKQENSEDGFHVDDALDALEDLDSVTDEDVIKTVAWAESAPKGANP